MSQYFGTDSQDAINSATTTAKIFDYVSIIGLVFYILMVMATSYLGGIGNPIMLVFTLILTLPTVIFSGVISDFVTQVVSNVAIGSSASQFPITVIIFENLPLISVVVLGISILVGFYGRQTGMAYSNE